MKFILFTYLVIALTPVVLMLAYAMVEFWTRTSPSYSLVYKLQNFKYRWAAEYKKDGLTPEGLFFTWLCFDAFCAGILTLILCAITNYHGFTPVLWGLLAVLLLIAPRYILDITKAIRYNFKTRDSDRLKDLESEVERLKTKIK